MKKVALLLAAAMLLGAFTACGSSNEGKGGDSVEELIASYAPDLTAYSFEKGISDLFLPAEGSHGLTLSGGAELSSVSSTVGTVSETLDVVSFPSEGARAEFTLDLSSPAHPEGQPYILEIMEMHSASYGGWGYTVSVNGMAVYFRTYEELISGRMNYFITVPEGLISDPSSVSVAVESEGGDRFSVASVWGYSDFYGLVGEEDLFTKLGINLYCTRDTEKAAAFIEKFSGYESFEASALFSTDYLDWPASDSAKHMYNAFLSAARTSGSMQYMLKSYWTFVDGPDGLGGYFSDLKYQQVLWHAASGGYTRTTPNGWSNTHWLSYAVDHVNNVSKLKLREILSEFADSVALAAAEGISLDSLALVIDHSIDRYIGENNVFYGGDFNPAMIQKVAELGVTLDPTDGMSYEEKEAIYTVLAILNGELAETYREAMGYNAVAVRSGEVTLPSDQAIENIWSHGTQTTSQWPSFDDRISSWVSGIGDNYWPSSEDMWFDDQRFYEYKLGYGRIGCVNLEMAIHGSTEAIQSFVSAAYANGMEYVTMFNDSDRYHTDRRLRQIDDVGSWLWTPNHYERVVCDLNYKRDYRPDLLTSPNESNIEAVYENCLLDTVSGELVIGDAGQASAVYRLDASALPESGLRLYIEAKAKENGLVEIYGGESLDALEKLGEMSKTQNINWFNDCGALSLDISEKTAGAESYYIKIVLSEQRLPGADPYVSLRALKLTSLWDKQSGSLVGAEETYYQKRLQNLYIAARRSAERLLGNYLEAASEDAVYTAAGELVTLGRYSSAQRLLLGELSQTLPAKYAVEGYGQLGKYPIYAELEGTAVIELETVGAAETILRIVSEESKTVDLTFSGLINGEEYIVCTLEQNRYALIPGENGTVAKNGKVTVRLSVTGRNEPQAVISDVTVSGRMYMNYSGSGQLLVCFQEPEIGGYDRFAYVTPASDCEFVRRPDGSNEAVPGYPSANDMVIVTLNTEGQAERIEAVYGEAVGKIVAFTPPTLTGEISNGVVTLDNGVSYELEFRGDTTFVDLMWPYGALRTLSQSEIIAAFRVGSTVRITYCPYSYNGSLPRVLSVGNAR